MLSVEGRGLVANKKIQLPKRTKSAMTRRRPQKKNEEQRRSSEGTVQQGESTGE